MKAVVAAFNQEKALVGAFSVITNLRMDLFEALRGGGGEEACVDMRTVTGSYGPHCTEALGLGVRIVYLLFILFTEDF